MKDEKDVLASSGAGASREAESVRPGEAVIEWRRLKNGAWLGYSGSQLLCIVEKIEDFPVEAWQPHCLRDAFTTAEAAMDAGELLLRSIARDEQPPPSMTQMYLPVLKGLVAVLENSLLVGRSQPDASTLPTEAK